jgi:hypothetical protein
MGSRNKEGHPKNDEFYTPKFIFDALGLSFTTDVCAPVDGVPWIPADKHYSLETDGLAQDWHGLIWCNPPYSNATPWMDKFMAHGNGIALVPTSKAKWFKRLWQEADSILMLESAFKFERIDGQRSDIFMPTVLVSMGEISTRALKLSGLGRAR